MNPEVMAKLLECEDCCSRLLNELQEDRELISMSLQADLLDLYYKQIDAEYEIVCSVKSKICNMQRK